MSTNLNSMFDEFNNTYDYSKVELNPTTLTKAHKLIQDEVDEIRDEICINFSKSSSVKELIDNIYITAQQLRAFGVDIDAALAEVHRSNLSKTVPANKATEYLEEVSERYPNAMVVVKDARGVLYCADTNKVIKPSIYSPAVITAEMFHG